MIGIGITLDTLKLLFSGGTPPPTPEDEVWTKVTKTYSDLAAASNANSITLASLAAKTALRAVVIKHTEKFGGGGILDYAVSVGIAGDETKYSTFFDVWQNVGDTTAQATDTGCAIENFGAATDIILSAGCTAALLSDASQGSVDVYLLTSELP